MRSIWPSWDRRRRFSAWSCKISVSKRCGCSATGDCRERGPELPLVVVHVEGCTRASGGGERGEPGTGLIHLEGSPCPNCIQVLMAFAACLEGPLGAGPCSKSHSTLSSAQTFVQNLTPNKTPSQTPTQLDLIMVPVGIQARSRIIFQVRLQL